MDLARDYVDRANRMRYPCSKCKNVLYKNIDLVEDHLFENGIYRDYTQWVHHGEDIEMIINDDDDDNDEGMTNNDGDNVEEVQEILEDIYAGTFIDTYVEESSNSHDLHCSKREEDKFTRFLGKPLMLLVKFHPCLRIN